jgi:hypothetical protein
MDDPARRAIPGLRASAAGAADDVGREIRGSTTILELLRMFPDGRAAKLMGEIQFPCAHCGGAVREPLTLVIRARSSRRFARSKRPDRTPSSSIARGSGVRERASNTMTTLAASSS